MIAVLGNIARDRFPGETLRTGGAPFHAARALAFAGIDGEVYARCAAADRDELLASVLALGVPVHYVPGSRTASFAISEHGFERRMTVLAIGDSWRADDVPDLPAEAAWVHVAPLLRSDFPAATLARAAQGRRLSLDGQGLVRAARLGELSLDAAYDPALLHHVDVLKLSDEEAALLGDPAALGVPEVLVTHGPVGATLYAAGRVAEIPADAVGGSHTGTGDAFCVSYLAAREAGLAPADAARRASGAVSALLRAGR